MSAFFRPWPCHGSPPERTTQLLISNNIKAFPPPGSEAIFRRASPAGSQQPRLSVRFRVGVLVFVIAVAK